jgi:FkbM family methyltransferase
MTPQSYLRLERGHVAPVRGGAPAGRLIRTLIHRSPIVRSVVKSAPVQHQVRTARALTVVRGRARFLANQLAGSRTARYELRASGLTVHLRHRSGDVAILNKIFARDASRNSYEPPAEIAAALGSAPRILDAGANIGLFGVFALGRWPGAQITAYEPDPCNRDVLRRTVAANDVGSRWTVVGAAVSNAPGELSFVPGLGAMAHIAGREEAGTITVPTLDLFDEQGDGVDLIKMDIEGGEWAILADARLSALKAKVIRLEWHTIHCPERDARAEAVKLLRTGGFERFAEGDLGHDRNGVLWAWRDPR